MSTPHTLQHRILSYTLVTAQFSLIAALLFSGHWMAHSRWLGLLQLIGIGLAAAAFFTMRTHSGASIQILPTPPSHGKLVTRGPYRFIRHPMYTSLLLFFGPPALSSHHYFPALLWLGLLVVLWGKSAFEERLLKKRFPEYAAYTKNSARFLPGFL